MTEYIEREALKKKIPHLPGFSMGRVEMYIDEFPAADVAPVVHGRWIDNGIPGSMLSGCSECGFTCGAYSFKYCPNCGAKMDNEAADGD